MRPGGAWITGQRPASVPLGSGRAWKNVPTVRGGPGTKQSGVWMHGERWALPVRNRVLLAAAAVAAYVVQQLPRASSDRVEAG
jgi:hypothetical protein